MAYLQQVRRVCLHFLLQWIQAWLGFKNVRGEAMVSPQLRKFLKTSTASQIRKVPSVTTLTTKGRMARWRGGNERGKGERKEQPKSLFR